MKSDELVFVASKLLKSSQKKVRNCIGKICLGGKDESQFESMKGNTKTN